MTQLEAESLVKGDIVYESSRTGVITHYVWTALSKNWHYGINVKTKTGNTPKRKELHSIFLTKEEAMKDSIFKSNAALMDSIYTAGFTPSHTFTKRERKLQPSFCESVDNKYAAMKKSVEVLIEEIKQLKAKHTFNL